jgi:hypothetical protein
MDAHAIDYYYQFQRLLETAAEKGAVESFWLECDKLESSFNTGPEEIQRLKDLMLRHGLWF